MGRAAAASTAALVPSGERDIVVLERERADAVASGREIRIENGGRGHEDGRFAHAAPEVARWHDDRFDLGHLVDAYHPVIVEVGLLDAAVLHGALAVEQCR